MLPFAVVWWHADRSVWPWALASTVLETVYVVALALSYRSGEVSFVYPLTRGLAPVLVPGFGAVALGHGLSAAEVGGVLLIAVGSCSCAARGCGELHWATVGAAGANIGSFMFLLLALRHGPAAGVLAVRSSSVVFVTIVAGRALSERVSRGRLTGSILVFAGIALLAI